MMTRLFLQKMSRIGTKATDGIEGGGIQPSYRRYHERRTDRAGAISTACSRDKRTLWVLE
jgi:hypothetical protein